MWLWKLQPTMLDLCLCFFYVLPCDSLSVGKFCRLYFEILQIVTFCSFCDLENLSNFSLLISMAMIIGRIRTVKIYHCLIDCSRLSSKLSNMPLLFASLPLSAFFCFISFLQWYSCSFVTLLPFTIIQDFWFRYVLLFYLSFTPCLSLLFEEVIQNTFLGFEAVRSRFVDTSSSAIFSLKMFNVLGKLCHANIISFYSKVNLES